MKILSNNEYQKLVESTNEVRNELVKTQDEMAKEYQRKFDHLTEDHAIAIKRKDAEVDLLIQSATNLLVSQVASLTLEKGNALKEVEILTKAFENLGFDVKDMKDILNKLVEGIISKNQIQLIK